MKIALFKSTSTGAIVPWDENFSNTFGSYIRISEWVDVEFKPLPVSETDNAVQLAKAKRLSDLYAEIAAMKGE